MDAGARLADRYVVRGTLGEGAQGTTYEALDEKEERVVAIKRFDVRGARSWKDVELAEREARVLSTLDHPLVPRYLDRFEENDALYLVMEKVEGETLEAIRQREGALPEEEVRRFLACADRATTYLHGRAAPVVHRDVKPRNVVRRADGSYVLVDFGAVAELVARRGASTVVGTLGYMAPEQLQGRATPATDVYAVGATALAALSGAEPDTLPHQGLRVDVRGVLGGRVSEAMLVTLERMLEPDPDRRAPSIAAALDQGSAIVSQPPPPAPAPAPLPPPGPLVDEDAMVASARSLLWLLWGLGWILVPVVLGGMLGLARFIPVVMFGSLAGIFVLTWHKNALLRVALRSLLGPRGNASVGAGPAQARPALRVESNDAAKVRVHTTELGPHEVHGATEVDSSKRARRARPGR
ncbi:MAG: serine/threonine protein kinase [Deltaproteobacteria bacterium]|nr:serine/threonine protein kinase [Deltaproteobacteria bacterium]